MKAETYNLKLAAMTQGGEAMGRDDTGRVVFVSYAIAGEEIVVEIVEEKRNYARARLVEIVKPSPARVAPRCAHFSPPLSVMGEGRKSSRGENPSAPKPEDARDDLRRSGGCGGCQWQHIAYEAQLKFKADIVREQFARIAKMPDAPVCDPIGMSDPWHYRNNVQFQLDSDGHLCFRALESHDLVRIDECHILHPLLDEMFRALELEGADLAGVTLRAGTRTGQKMVILEGRDDEPPEISVDEPISIVYQTPGDDTSRGKSGSKSKHYPPRDDASGEMIPLVGKDALHEELRGHVFRVSPQSFFQVNTAMAETLVDLVERYLAPRGNDVLLDAFGGVGTFGLLLAPRVARVIEVEENPFAVSDACANAVELSSSSRSGHVEFHRGKVEDVLPRLKTKVDIAVADPPRAGIAVQALDALIAHAPAAIVYVSCDPATLARDAWRLVDGGYRLVEVQPVDMFPQTYHIETVSWFERK